MAKYYVVIVVFVPELVPAVGGMAGEPGKYGTKVITSQDP
jgi:hypothetical protein